VPIKVFTIRGVCVLIVCLTFGSAFGESIQGTVVIKKKLTKRRVTAQIPMYERGTAVALGADTAGDPLEFERARVAVYLEAPPAPDGADSTPSAIATMQQENRRFSPEVLVITAGSKVSFPNMDPIFHNVFSLSGPKAFDLGNYAKGDTRLVTFPKAGVVYVNCHLHPNMTAAIVVAPNRWNTLVDREGKFELKDIPPGKYTVVAWHKTAGFFRQIVSIGTGADKRVEFLIPVDDNGRKLEHTLLHGVAGKAE
jgi:plastocyanin